MERAPLSLLRISQMAEAADLRQGVSVGLNSAGQREEPLQEGGDEEDEFYRQSSPLDFDFGSFSPDNASPFLDYYMNSSFNFEFDLDSESENHGFERENEESNGLFFGGEEDEDPMNFITDLFESRHATAAEDPVWELDFGPTEDFSLGRGFVTGHRVAGVDSDYDSDDYEVNPGVITTDENGFYDNLHAEIEPDEFEWDEVSDRSQFDDRENLNSVINGIEEISVSSEISSSVEEDEEEEEATAMADEEVTIDQQNAEWEFLLTVSDINTSIAQALIEEEEEDEAYGDVNQSLHVHLPEDYILSMEHGALFGQLPDNENHPKGSPPASQSALENLPQMVLTKQEVGEDIMLTCAVCKDEFTVGEKVTTMPCQHMYHGECIFPWLNIRNTCPVCRYELPTDDEIYERRRGERGGRGAPNSPIMDDEFPVRYNFEVLPL